MLEQSRHFNRQTSPEALECQLAEEKLRRHDLEGKLRIMELDSLGGPGSGNEGADKGLGEHEAPNSDYTLLVNTVIWLVNKHASGSRPHDSEPGSFSEKDITSVKE